MAGGFNPDQDSETVWICGVPVRRVDIERGVYQPENATSLTGEYEVFIYEDCCGTVMQVNLEVVDLLNVEKEIIEDNFLTAFFQQLPELAKQYAGGTFKIFFSLLPVGKLSFLPQNGDSRRFFDQRKNITSNKN